MIVDSRLLQRPMVFDMVIIAVKAWRHRHSPETLCRVTTSTQPVLLLRARCNLLNPDIFPLSQGVSLRVSLSFRPPDAPPLVAL